LTIAEGKNAEIRKLLSATDSDIRQFAALYFIRNGTTPDKKAIQAAYDGESDEDVRILLAAANAAIKKRAAAAKKASAAAPASTATKKKTSGPKAKSSKKSPN
jgi:hypothetical protein